MKTYLRYLLPIALVALVIVGCQKEEDPTKIPEVTEESVEASDTAAIFSWKVDWLGKFASVVEVSENEDMSDSQTFGSETETVNKDFTATANGLKEVTRYYYRFLIWNKNFVNNKFKTEVKSFTTKSGVPKVKTTEVTDVTRTTATVICEVTDESGATVTERGVYWGTTPKPTTNGNHLSSGNGMGTYSVAISDLEVGMTYYVQAYAKNENGTAYGDTLSFVTGDAVKPTVITEDVFDIDWRTATGGGTVTDDGDATVTERGICWSMEHNPTVEDNDHANSGTGMGNFTANMSGLTAGTTYYVRAYAKNIAGRSYGNEVSFETRSPEKPTVTTVSVTSITHQSAVGNGNVVSDGGTGIIERGVCWSTSHNPTIDGSYVSSGTGIGSFTCTITNLNSETQYYVCAYATNSVGTSYGSEESFTTLYEGLAMLTTAEVSFIGSNSATCGGKVTYDGGHTVEERGVCWSTSPNPDINGSHVSSGSGSGSFAHPITNLEAGTQYFVRAYATNSFGTKYGDEVSFTTRDTPISYEINGLFSVSSFRRVYFSQGNLLYRASDGQWQFAEYQYDVIGSGNSNISSSYNGWIDLFGWGTSGWNSGAVCYQPWSASIDDLDYYPGGSYTNNLTGDYANADWGVYNAIGNGGNQAGQWRTLTKSEWNYLFNTRSTTSGIRFAKACVNGVNGVILLPDNWSPGTFQYLCETNNPRASFSSNTMSASWWKTSFETSGAVFLPAAGTREGTWVGDIGSEGFYWSSWYYDDIGAYSVWFHDSALDPEDWFGRSWGLSVRLVRNAQ